MISDPSWYWDMNDELQDIQQRTFVTLVCYLYHEMRHRYLWAVELVGVTPPLAERVRNTEMLKSFFPLQEMYRAMAAHYRLEHDKYRGQRTLPLDGLDDDTRQEREWVDYFKAEVEDLLRHGHYVKSVLSAVVYDSEPEGNVEQRHLLTLLRERYENRECVYCRPWLTNPKPWEAPRDDEPA